MTTSPHKGRRDHPGEARQYNSQSRPQPIRLTIAQTVCRTLPPIVAQRIRTLIYPATTARRDDYEFVVRAQTGSLLRSRTSDFHGYPFCVHGYYEWRNWAIALACCTKGDTIVEVGANIGTETVGFADIVGREGVVCAFEPLPSNAAALRDTLALNSGRVNVRVYPVAVGDTIGKTPFVVPVPHSSGTGHVLQAGEGTNRPVVEVDCVTLDSLQREVGASRLLVIDAEGEEIRILRGAREYIGRSQPVIVLEASPELLMRAGFSLGDLHLEITYHQYEVYRVSRLGLSQRGLMQSRHASNWVCIPAFSAERTAGVIASHLRKCGLRPCLAALNPLTSK